MPGAAAKAAVAGRVGGSCPAAVVMVVMVVVMVMVRGLGQGLWVEYQAVEEMSSFQPLQQLTWGQGRVQHR